MSEWDAQPLEVKDRVSGLARRPRLLLSAYACSPEQGSEPGVGWHRALQAARHCDTWVLCEARSYGPPLRRYLETHGPLPGLTFVFVPGVSWLRGMRNLPGFDYWWYNLWQRRAYRTAQQLHATVGFDFVHQVTFCGYREPGYLARLGLPVVWGPVGGTQNYPWLFLGLADPLGGLREIARTAVNRLQLAFSARIHRAARGATVLLAANTTVQRDLTRIRGVAPLLQLETGVAAVADDPDPAPARGPLRILWSGELRCYKALPLLLHALARLPAEVAYEVRILGTGPLQKRWERLAARLEIGQRVQWLGWLPFAKALEQYASADVLAFTSLRDTSGNVVLEALARGVPVLCLDHQGVADIVTPACGIKVPVTRPADTIAGLTAALHRLALEPALRERLAAGTRSRAREYLWSRQGARMTEVYRQVLGEQQGESATCRSDPLSMPTNPR